MTTELEYGKYLARVNPMDILIRVQESKEFIDKGKIDDALAYAIAAGIRLGIKAVLENKDV